MTTEQALARQREDGGDRWREGDEIHFEYGYGVGGGAVCWRTYSGVVTEVKKHVSEATGYKYLPDELTIQVTSDWWVADHEHYHCGGPVAATVTLSEDHLTQRNRRRRY